MKGEFPTPQAVTNQPEFEGTDRNLPDRSSSLGKDGTNGKPQRHRKRITKGCVGKLTDIIFDQKKHLRNYRTNRNKKNEPRPK